MAAPYLYIPTLFPSHDPGHPTYTFNALAEEAHVFTQILTIYEITYTSVVDEDDVQITIYWN